MPNNRTEYCEMNSRKDLQFKLRINILRKDCDLWVPRTHLVPIEEISLLIGAKGGGHGLAGGLRLDSSKLPELLQKIDQIIEKL